jgi:hypothetical protein
LRVDIVKRWGNNAAMKNTRIGTRDEEQEGESFQGKLGARQGKRYPALKKARGGKATGGI